jgi:hypothetical protein
LRGFARATVRACGAALAGVKDSRESINTIRKPHSDFRRVMLSAVS